VNGGNATTCFVAAPPAIAPDLSKTAGRRESKAALSLPSARFPSSAFAIEAKDRARKPASRPKTSIAPENRERLAAL
jgi:hypothetical protein